ncbi:cytochrome c oxidase assembly protein [Nocardia sp. NPDC051030]|uniref:cytochrome c oxidase assembly protein n=1 Tax=Nocardia sp. NPDC051030 TaxID=3155162 RepID=UPI003429BB77
MDGIRSGAVRWCYPIAVMVAGGLVLVSLVAAGEAPYREAGVGYPGLGAALGYVLLRVIAAVAGGVALGALVYTVCCTAANRDGRVEVDGYAGLRVVQRASVLWMLAAIALIPVSAADLSGLPLSRVVRTGALAALIEADEKPKAWIVVALLAGMLAVGSRLTLTWVGAVLLAVVAAIGVLPPAMVGNAGEGPGHDYATGAMILFQPAVSALVGLLGGIAAQVRRKDSRWNAVAVQRGVRLGALCLVVAGLSGMVVASVLLPISAVASTGYGRLAGLVVAIGVGLAVLLWRCEIAVRTGRVEQAGTLLRCGAALSAVALTALTAMAVQPAPAFIDQKFTAQEVYLGFDLPGPLTVLRLLTFWRFDFVLGTAALVGIALYAAGVRRLHRRGDDWSRLRTLSWVSGCVVLLISTSSGIGAYGYAMFSMHMITHMVLNMGIPVLLVLGAPMTLLLRAVPAAKRDGMHGIREWTLRLLHSKPAAVVAHPATALTVFVLSLYGLYFTSLFENLIRFHWGHTLMNVHFLIVGYLYYWGVIGIDPGPRRLPHLGRLGVLFAVMPFHAFFGVAVMSGASVIGDRFYSQLMLPWTVNLLDDQHMGGGIAWVSGEVPVLLVVGALLTQWIGQERRVAVRNDRKEEVYGDSDLDAYNEMLRQLAATRR